MVNQEWAKRVAKAMDRLAAVYEITLTETRVEAYTEALADLRAEALEGGAKTLEKTSKWFPRPVEWREAAQQWEAEEAERRRIAWEMSRPRALPAHEPAFCTPEQNLEVVRAIVGQFRYLVNRKPIADRPHNRHAPTALDEKS